MFNVGDILIVRNPVKSTVNDKILLKIGTRCMVVHYKIHSDSVYIQEVDDNDMVKYTGVYIFYTTNNFSYFIDDYFDVKLDYRLMKINKIKENICIKKETHLM